MRPAEVFKCSSCKQECLVNPWHKYLCKRCSSKHSSKAQRRFRDQILTCPICLEQKSAWIFTTCRDCYNSAAASYQKSKYVKLWQWYFELKSKPCTDCGIQFHPTAMEWDHRDKDDKTSAVSTLLFSGASQARILEEIEKCELVCANCHRVRTWTRRRLP